MKMSVEFKERQLLSTMLLHSDGVSRVMWEGVRSSHYSTARHSLLHDAIVNLTIDTGGRIDAVILSEFLTRSGQLEVVGGDEYLIEILETLPAWNNLAEVAASVMRQ
ncbi:MAG: hypothetical protein HQ518_07690 [Rhodopirellula sp.]|nr:hypothetical protein [Rhodopirellula sp.]